MPHASTAPASFVNMVELCLLGCAVEAGEDPSRGMLTPLGTGGYKACGLKNLNQGI